MKALVLAFALSALTTAGSAGDDRQEPSSAARTETSSAPTAPGLALVLLSSLLLVPRPLARALRRREQARRADALASTLAQR